MFNTKKQLNALSALKGVAAAAITAVQLAEVQAEFDAEGIELEVVARGETRITQTDVDAAVTAAVEAQATALSGLQDSIASTQADLEAANATIAERDAEVARLNALAVGENAPARSADSVHTTREKGSAFDHLKEQAAQVSAFAAKRKGVEA